MGCTNSLVYDKSFILWQGSQGGKFLKSYDYNNTNTVTDLTNGDIVLGQYPSNMGYDSESKVLVWTQQYQP